MKLHNITEIENELREAAPGTHLRINDYVSSDGSVRSLELELLAPEAYQDMLMEDFSILKDIEPSEINLEGDAKVSLVDMMAAQQQLLESRAKSIEQARQPVEPAQHRGPKYERLHFRGSLAVLPEKEGVLYILKLRLLGDLPNPKLAKGSVPRAKQILAQNLNLPTLRYLHAVALQEGKFSSLEVLKCENTVREKVQ